MKCSYLAEKQTTMWKHGNNVMWLEDSKMIDDSRLYKFPNNTVLIRRTSSNDSGSYTCEIVGIAQVEHVVNVVGEFVSLNSPYFQRQI